MPTLQDIAASAQATEAPAWKGRAGRAADLLPGLVLCGVLAGAGMVLGEIPWFAAHGLSALTLAIVLGMVVGNTLYPAWSSRCAVGTGFSKQRLLRLGIVLYGLRLTLQDVAHVGLVGIAIDAVMLMSTFGLACWIGRRWLGMDASTVMLIGAGSSICGAAAVLATEPVIRAKSEQVTVAVATVVIFGTLSIFLYPALYEWAPSWLAIPGGVHGFGVFTGSTVHEVAQVVAAARGIGPEAADAAVIAKMVRVMMLAPFLVVLSAWIARRGAGPRADSGRASPGIVIPWFAFVFLGVVVGNSFGLLSSAATAVMTDIDTVLLAMAMAALGLTTRLDALRQAGIKPLALAAMLYVWLVVGGALINGALLAR